MRLHEDKLLQTQKPQYQGFVEGDHKQIMNDLAQSYNVPISKKGSKLFFKTGNVRVGFHYSTVSNVPTIDINFDGVIYKIRTTK